MKRRRGFVVLMLVFLILSLTLSSVLVLFSRSLGEYRSAAYQAGRVRAKMLAQSGLETAILVVTRIPPEQLYQFGLFASPISFPLGNGIVSLTLQEETGKININRLVHFFDDEMDLRTREMLDRLATSFSLSYEIWDAVVDYIDENSTPMPKGFEKEQYLQLNPPRRIKNSRLHSLEELLLIPGFDRRLVYEDIRSEALQQERSMDFLTEEERLAVTKDDFILANNLTTALPYDPLEATGERININTAPYHVVLSLSEFMTPTIARKIIASRFRRGGRFRNMAEMLQSVPELSQRTTGDITLAQEIEQRIVFQDRLYKIVSEASLEGHTAHVMAYFDVVARKITSYLE
ncbi:MAG: type II secretion system protein GspK [Leptospiraceae bacterium]|nr:type II secretion system protein GspK [Leptospiraceae bacterium]